MEQTENTQLYMEKCLALLREGETVPLPVQGNSMAPFLVHGRDTVFLSALTDLPKVGDIVLYRRAGNRYILHRVYARSGDLFTMLGDAHTLREAGVHPDQLLAVAVGACRKGREIGPGSLCWEFFARVWVRMVSPRPTLLSAYTRITKPFRRNT